MKIQTFYTGGIHGVENGRYSALMAINLFGAIFGKK